MRAVEENINFPNESIRCLVRCSESYDFEWHYHQAYELTYILKGSGHRFMGDHLSNYEVGDFVFIPPSLPHTWVSAETSDVNEGWVIQFSKHFIKETCDNNPIFRSLRKLLSNKSALLFPKNILSDFEKDLAFIMNSSGVSRVGALFLFLDKLAEVEASAIPLSSSLYKPDLDNESRSKMDQLHRIIRSREVPKVENIADQLGMSESTFRRFLLKNTGKSFINYLNEWRVALACRKLLETSQSISQIAYDSGFDNLAHFNRVFKRVSTYTPREYRTQQKT
jgi:AraC-like DNA-binding protein